ncbi:MAG: TatD family hydrolase [Patescibacteria group bacterium]
MYIDTHCHLNFKDFKDDYNEVIKRSLEGEVEMIVVGSELKTSQRAVSLSESFDKGVYSAVGLHPIHLQDVIIKNDNENGKYEFRSRKEEYSEDNYIDLIKNKKNVVAIGEIGLDYYHIDGDREKVKEIQREVFFRQLTLAKKMELPVIIHCREAHDDLFRILKDFHSNNNFTKEWGVIHCYSGDYNQAKKYFDLGLKISFTGLVTFVRQWDEVIKKSPLDKLMIETDSPYLSPSPYRGKRNEPLYVKEVAKVISDLRNEDVNLVKNKLYKNSIDFFGIR